MANFSINDLSELSGVKKHTIRVWEQRYSFLKPRRLQSQRRSYTEEELVLLLDAALLNQNGYRISMIDKMSLEKKLQVFSRITDEQQKAVHNLIIHMAKMDSAAFDATLDQAVQTWGIHEAMQQVLLPFCEKVGLLQGTCNKNFIENIILIRQSVLHKLVAATEQVKGGMPEKETILLFSAGTVSEIAVLHVQYRLALDGFRVLHLGQQLSVEHLAAINSRICPGYIVGFAGKGNWGMRNLDLFVESLAENGKAKFISIGDPLTLTNTCPHYACFPSSEKFLDVLCEKQPAEAY